MPHWRCGALKQSSKLKSQHLKAAERNRCRAYTLLERNWENWEETAARRKMHNDYEGFIDLKNCFPLLYIHICISHVLLLSGAGCWSQFVPTGGEHRWNYYPDHATRLTHLLLQVCCLIWMSEGVRSVFVLFPHYFASSRKATPCDAGKASSTDVTPPSTDPAHVTH